MYDRINPVKMGDPVLVEDAQVRLENVVVLTGVGVE